MKSLLQTIKDNSELIENAVRSCLEGNEMPYEVLLSSMRYSAYAGGKRIRPFLTLECAKALGGNAQAAIPFACGIEFIHTYSLIHDDLPCMDNDDMRRGKPTNHKVYGEANALLAGDALLTYGFQVTASNRFVSPETALEAVKILSDNAGKDGMIGGQVLDLTGEKEELSYENFLLMNRLKTGCLIKTACLLGALSAGYGKGTKEYEALTTYADNIGLSFQIEDDILDDGTEENKTTFLTFMSKEEAKAKIDELTRDAIDAVKDIDRNGTLREFALYLSNREV